MGDVLRIVGEDSSELGRVPRPFSQVLGDAGFRRTLPRDVMGGFLRSATAPEREHPGTAAGVVLAGLRRVEAFEREDRERRLRDAGLSLAAGDLVLLRCPGQARVYAARVRTGFGQGAWDERLHGPITAEDPWRDVPEGETRAWVQAVLGAVDVRADGSIVRPGHARREGPLRGSAGRFEARERAIELRFVAPHEHPDWQALLGAVAERPGLELRFTAW